jgi:hypothetical protein
VKQETLDKAQAISTIVSAVAIPFVIAVVGWWVQSSLKSEDLKKDYVQMAVGILENREKQKDDDLRKWAVDILDENAPIAFSRDLRIKLESGEAQIRFFFLEPPEVLMQPPRSLEMLPADQPATSGDVILNMSRNYAACRENAFILENLQEWARKMHKYSLEFEKLSSGSLLSEP